LKYVKFKLFLEIYFDYFLLRNVSELRETLQDSE